MKITEKVAVLSTCKQCGAPMPGDSCEYCGVPRPQKTERGGENPGSKWGPGGKMYQMVDLALRLDAALPENGGGGKDRHIVIETIEQSQQKTEPEPQRKHLLRRAFDSIFLRKSCPGCGTTLGVDAKFCHQCRHQF